jgi:type II restriction enzyme
MEPASGGSMRSLLMNQSLAVGYASKSQKIRVMSEAWTESEIFCPACGSDLESAPNNSKVFDFLCTKCTEQYELKSNAKSFAKKASDGAFDSMISRLNALQSPHFFFMGYDISRYEVKNFFVVPSHFLRPASIEKRKPLSPGARRAGWVGCNILLDQIPDVGRISYIKNGLVIQPESVMNAWKKTAFLAESKSIESRGWTIDVLSCIEKIGHAEFSLDEMYRFEAELAMRYPNNHFIKDKIRQQLQVLRDKGCVEFIRRGKYRLVTNTDFRKD